VTSGRKAPHYVFLQTASGHSGDTGELDEMAPGSRANCAVMDSSDLQVNADGTFEIPLAPAGANRLVVWHEAIGFRNGREGRNGAPVKIEGAAVTDLGDITIKPVTP
jgi:hypothetical protein